MPTTDEYQTMLTALVNPPFNKKYTLISLSQAFDNQKEIFNLLKEVCIKYPAKSLQDESQQTDLTSCSDEEAADYITQKYAILAFENENATYDEEAIAKNLLQPHSQYLEKILLKLLSDPIQAQKIVYTHRFTQNAVRGQFSIDSQLLKQRLENIAEFNKLYQQLEEIREKQSEKMLFAEKQQASQLQAQNDKLNDKNKNIQIQLQQHPEQAQDFLQLSSRLREAKTEIQQLKEQISKSTEQKVQYLKQSDQLQQLAQGTPASILEQTRQDNIKYRNNLLELPNEIQEKQALKKLIIGDVSEEQVLKYEDDLTNIKQKLHQLQESNGISNENDQDIINTNTNNTVDTLKGSLLKFQLKEKDLKTKLEHLKNQNQMLNDQINDSTAKITLDNIDSIEKISKLQYQDFVAQSHSAKQNGVQVQYEKNQLKKQIVIGKRTVELLQQQVRMQDGNIYAQDNDQGQQSVVETLEQLQQSIKNKRNNNLTKINEYHTKKQQLAQINQNLDQIKNQLQSDNLQQNQALFKLRLNVEKQKNENEQLLSDIQNLSVYIQEQQVRKAIYSSDDFLPNLLKKHDQVKEQYKQTKEQFAKKREEIKDAQQQKKMFDDMIKILQTKIESVKIYKEENNVNSVNGQQYIKLQ